MEETKRETKDMQNAKKSFVQHLQRARAQGIAIGQKAVATAIMSYIEAVKPEDSESIKEAFAQVKSLCEKTIGFTLEEFVEKVGTIQEMMDVAENAGEEEVKEDVVSAEVGSGEAQAKVDEEIASGDREKEGNGEDA